MKGALKRSLGAAWRFKWIAAMCLASCSGGGGNANGNPGSGPLLDVSRTASLSRDDVSALFNGPASVQQQLAQLPVLAGAPDCGIDVHYFHYTTAGARGEPTTASGVLMAPTGAAGCSGPRPIVVYTHGTAATKAYNLAQINDPTNEAWQESAMVAAFFAAHGYIVVASNYAGYDTSPLPYHAYLNADQQSKDVIDALTAARSAMASGLPSGDSDNGKLFVTGYSEGGHVAMATARAMQSRGMQVTAAAPMSGPYAMLAFGDAVVANSEVGLSSTVYYPMVINSYQNAYGNVYRSLTDVYSPTYAAGIDTLLPGNYSFNTIFSSGKLPQAALFNSTTPGTGNEPGTGIPELDAAMQAPDATVNPVWSLGFGDPYLVNNRFRVAYAQDEWANPDGAGPHPTDLLPAASPAFGLRQDLKKNDLRGWQPAVPVLLCGGMNDPDVSYPINTLTMRALWSNQIAAGSVQVIDVDPTSNGNLDEAGKIVTVIGSIVGNALASNSGTDPSAIADSVRNAIVSDAAFSSLFGGSGAPASPQGVMVLEMAETAKAAVLQSLQGGANSPDQLGGAVTEALLEGYHFPLTQTACLVGVQSWFARFAGSAAMAK